MPMCFKDGRISYSWNKERVLDYGIYQHDVGEINNRPNFVSTFVCDLFLKFAEQVPEKISDL